MNRKIAGALALAVTIAGCSGGAGGSSMTPAMTTQSLVAQPAAATQAASAAVLAPYKGAANEANFTWGKAMREKLTYVKPITAGAISVDVLVKMRNAAGLVQYAESTSDKTSANYRHFLTPSELADRFGASPADYKNVATYFANLGMRVGMWPQRQVLTVTGTLGQFKRAFNTDFGVFTYGKTTVVAPIQTPHTSKALPIASVQHLVGYNPAHTYNIRGSYANWVGYSPQIIASGFDFSGAFAAGYNGAGINVAVNGTGPIAPADAALYATAFNDTVAPITQINASPQPASAANGHTGTGAVDPYPAGLAVAPPVTAPCALPNFPTPPNYNKCNPEDIEAQLDTQSQIGLAPGANVLFYLAYNPSICVSPTTGQFVENNKDGSCPSGSEAYPLIGIQLADDSLQQTIADNLADTISLSWGEPENEALFDDYISANPSTPGVGQIEFASLAAEGIAVFVSSGDNGAWECFNPETGQPLGVACVSYPASDPNVDAVGGVNAPFLENGRLNGQITAWSDNTTYGGNGEFENNVGSGGGISTVFAPPPWQKSAIKGITKREVPDSSLLADPNTGVAIVIYAGFKGDTAIFPEGGTSASAPESAAMWGDVLSACKKFSSCATSSGSKPYRLGNAAPYFYDVYQGKGNLAYTQSVYDVVYGDNQAVPAPTPTPVGNATPAPFPTPVGYKAGKGYDMVTGVGVPFVGHFIDSLIKGAGAQ